MIDGVSDASNCGWCEADQLLPSILEHSVIYLETTRISLSETQQAGLVTWVQFPCTGNHVQALGFWLDILTQWILS
jgi:hypothetical protein